MFLEKCVDKPCKGICKLNGQGDPKIWNLIHYRCMGTNKDVNLLNRLVDENVNLEKIMDRYNLYTEELDLVKKIYPPKSESKVTMKLVKTTEDDIVIKVLKGGLTKAGLIFNRATKEEMIDCLRALGVSVDDIFSYEDIF